MIWRSSCKRLVTACYRPVNATGGPRDRGTMVSSMPSNPALAGRLRLRIHPRILFAAALPAIALLALLAPMARAAGSGSYGQTQRFGGFDVSAAEGKTLTPGEFLEPRGFALDTQDSTGGAHDTAVYVLDRTSDSDGVNPSAWRIQKFSEDGALLGTTTFSLENKKFTATAVEGLTVDHAAGRLYALVVGQPSGDDIDEPVAQELIAWSITPNGSQQLVPASGLSADPLGTGAGLVSSKAQLQPSGATPLYQPQGIAVDPTGEPGTAPVAIEATDLAAGASSGGDPQGNTVVQQVATSGTTGALLGKWSSESVASQLSGRSWGPGGISLNPDGSLTALLNDVGEGGLVYAVNLNAKLTVATVLDSTTSLPERGNFDELPFAGVDPPYGKASTGPGISQVQGAGSELVQLSAPGSSTTGGLYAAMFATPKGKDIQTENEFFFHEGVEELVEEEGVVTEFYFRANIGVRLLQPEGGLIANPKGKTIVNTLANPEPGAACNFGSGSSLALAAGNEGALWVLVQGPLAELIHGTLKPSNTATGGEIVELEPGAGTACPQPSGNFAMQAPERSWQEGNTELLIAAGTTVKFDAFKPESKGGPSGLDIKGATPFAYEWQLDNEDATNGEPINEMLAPQFDVPPSTAEYTYTVPGVYKVKLTFRGDYGSYTTQEGTVRVIGELVPPTAQFEVTTGSPKVGESVGVDASGSQGGSGKITGYEWNWGDGSPSESVEGTTTSAHAYTKAGTYTVKLVVSNNLNQKSVASSQQVTVSEPTIETIKETIKETPPPPPPPPTADRSPTNVSPHASENKAKGTITLSLSCPATKVSCAGTVTIETANAVAAKAKKSKRKRVVLGQASFSLSGGQSETLTLHLSSAGAKLLSKLKHAPTMIIVSAHDSFGDPGTQDVSITLTAGKPKKHH